VNIVSKKHRAKLNNLAVSWRIYFCVYNLAFYLCTSITTSGTVRVFGKLLDSNSKMLDLHSPVR